MTITCTRRIQFASGHRVYGHESKCANPHGHNFVVLVTAQAAQLDDVGRVIDFSVLKERVGGWIDRNWDHAFIYYARDPIMSVALAADPDWKVYEAPFNPTSENIAAFLLGTVCPEVLAGTRVEVTAVRVWETENCYADARL